MFDGPHLRFRGVNEAVAESVTKTFTSTFKDNKLNTQEEGANIWSASVAANSYESSSSARGVQFTKSTVLTGKLGITNAQITKITFVLSANKSNKTIELGDESFSVPSGTSKKEFTFKPANYTGDTEISTTITIPSGSSQGSMYVSSITIEYTTEEGGTPDPTTPIDATVTITPNPINVVAGETADVTIETNYDGAITVTPEDNSIADAIYENNLIVVEGIAKGATNITISGTGSTKYNDFTRIVAVNVSEKEDPTDPTTDDVLYYETFGNASKQTAVADYTGRTALASYFTNNSTSGNYIGEGKIYKKASNEDTNSHGYTDASGESCAAGQGTKNVTSDTELIKITNINISQYKDLKFSFGSRYDNGNNTTNTISVKYQIDNGEEYTIENFTNNGTTWTLNTRDLNGEGSSLTIAFIHHTVGGMTARIDDIKITGTKKTTTEPEAYTLKVGATGYSTLCLDKAYTMPEGLEGAIVTVSDNILAVDYLYTEGEIVAAGMPLLIKAAQADEYTLTYTSEEGTDLKDETMMSGETDAEGMTVGEAGSKFYKLAAPEAGIGFYWGAPDGGAFKNGADKAYLVVPGTVNVQGFRFDGTITGISGIAGATDTDAAIYTLDGRRVSGKADELSRGIYIVGGKKVIK